MKLLVSGIGLEFTACVMYDSRRVLKLLSLKKTRTDCPAFINKRSLRHYKAPEAPKTAPKTTSFPDRVLERRDQVSNYSPKI
jgi:hypothetical protein